MRRSSGLGLWVAWMALGCGDGTAPHDRELSAAGECGGIRSPCDGEPIATPVAWDEQTALAISAREAFASTAGRCEAPLSWDASGAGVALEPASGEAGLIVRVTIDEGSARLVQPQPRAPLLIDCAPLLEVDAHVALESDDGTFADSADVTLLYREDSGVAALSFSRAPSQLGGSLQVSAEPGTDVSIQYRVSGAGDACAGEIAISTSMVRGNMGSGSIGTIGRWSNTGCALGEEPLRLGGSSVRGTNIVRAIEDAFREASYPGAWEDGVAGDLQLSLEIDAAVACAQRAGNGIIAVPVQLTYGTSDGRVEAHTAQAHVNVWTSGDDVSELGLVLSESMACRGDDASLAYTAESCETLSGVEAQISFNYYLSGSGTSGGRLEVYKYRDEDRNGAADGVDRWVSE